jgi:hypothetical protein
MQKYIVMAAKTTGPRYEKRKALIELAHKLEDKRNEETAIIPNDDEGDALFDRVFEKYSALYMPLYQKVRALAYCQPKNEWFCNVFCKSFEDGHHNISAKQADIFSRYCQSDDNTWRSNEYYCVVNNRLITFRPFARHNSSVTFETLIDENTMH